MFYAKYVVPFHNVYHSTRMLPPIRPCMSIILFPMITKHMMTHVHHMPKEHVVVDVELGSGSPIWMSSPSWPGVQLAAEIEQVKPGGSMHGTDGAATGAAGTMLERSAPVPHWAVPEEERGERWWRRMAGTMFDVGPMSEVDSDVETELALDIGMELAMIDFEHDLEQGMQRQRQCTEPPLSDVDVLWGVDV